MHSVSEILPTKVMENVLINKSKKSFGFDPTITCFPIMLVHATPRAALTMPHIVF